MVTKCSLKVRKACLISGTAGIEGTEQRTARALADDLLAEQLRSRGIERFTEEWYKAAMWKTFTCHAR